jgi:ankyrin repeat protein
LLLDHKADINAPSGWRVDTARFRGDPRLLPIAKLLIDRGADIRVVDKSGMTALNSAAGRGWTEIARLLIQKGADLNARDNDGTAPLDAAILKEFGDTAALLVQAGAEISRAHPQTGATPLNEAATKGLTRVVGLLLTRNADVSVKDKAGFSPVQNAVRFHHNGVAELLLAAEKNAGTAGASAGLLEEAVVRGYADTVEMLFRHGADVSARFRSGSTPLHDAALKGHDEIVRLVLAKGADVNARNGSGGTPLHDAALNGKVTTARILLARGADINAQAPESGTTALYAAASLGRRRGHAAAREGR